jgi:GT2 family glycosyltransferase
VTAVTDADLSIVVPTRDTAALTLACLASIARARPESRPDSRPGSPPGSRPGSGPGSGPEIVVVDDGSRDDTVARVRAAYPAARIVRQDAARGFTVTANAGLAAARGRLLLLLNSDTEIEPGGLDALTAAFAGDSALGIAGAQLRHPDGSPQWSGGRLPDCLWLFAEASGAGRLLRRLPSYRRARPLARATDRDVDWVSGAALAMRREVWEACGPLDEAYTLYGQDLDLCSRARRAGWRIRVLHGFAVRHHHGATVTAVEGSAGRQHAPRLWTDLRRWAGKTYGVGYARRATWALRLGGWLRLAGRAILAPAISRARRAQWSGESGELRAALAALRGPS